MQDCERMLDESLRFVYILFAFDLGLKKKEKGMLNPSEILEVLKNVPQGYLMPDDNLFTTNNYHLLKLYKKLGAISSAEFDDGNVSTHTSLDKPVNEIFCNVFGCDMIFNNVCTYQSHYNTMHRFICAECKKSTPTDHLLDLHISEHHDSYFKARVERGEPLYKCYLEECQELFLNPQERKDHCIKEHKFPSNFRFDKMEYKGLESKGNKSGKGHAQMEMAQVGGEKHSNRNKEFKLVSFGHNREKTFRPKDCPNLKPESGKPLENMDTLKEALNSM